MIAVDTNILVYAHRQDSPFFSQASQAMLDLTTGSMTWALPWPCLHEFFSVVTNRRLFAVPSTAAEALDQIEAWLGSVNVRPIAETSDHLTRLRPLLEVANHAGPQVHDAKIAAICLGHGVRELLTMDRDFSRYPGLKTRSLVA